jgi:hypothetical protein
MQEVSKHNYGKMTLHEKRLNKEELVHFKKHDPDVQTLIPGLNNSSAGVHLVRTQRRQGHTEPGRLGMSMSGASLPGLGALGSPT